MSRGRVIAAALTLAGSALLVAGCATAGEPAEPGDEAAAGGAGGSITSYLCHGEPIPASALDDRRGIDALGARGRVALAEAAYDDGSALDLGDAEEWFVVVETDQRVTLMRESIEPREGDDLEWEAGAFETVSVEWIEATNVTGWLVTQRGVCPLTRDLGDLQVPEVALDPDNPPDPGSTTLHLLVTERSCNSGEDARGRIEVVSLSEDPGRVEFVLGVRPRGGAHDCPSNPATPFALTLAEPLGQREVVDGSLVTARILTIEK